METLDKDMMNTVLFYQLVNTFQNAAWQQLGKRVNPLTEKVEKDFDQASLSIGMLDMLATKTAGNLSDEEQKFLDQVVADLKLNYVEEVEKGDTGTPEDDATDEPEGEEKSNTIDEENKPKDQGESAEK
jgi:hypothetical protein